VSALGEARGSLRFRTFSFPHSPQAPGTFTFTLNCHLGKTHSHRSRGDPTWEAQRAPGTKVDPRSTPDSQLISATTNLIESVQVLQ